MLSKGMKPSTFLLPFLRCSPAPGPGQPALPPAPICSLSPLWAQHGSSSAGPSGSRPVAGEPEQQCGGSGRTRARGAGAGARLEMETQNQPLLASWVLAGLPVQLAHSPGTLRLCVGVEPGLCSVLEAAPVLGEQLGLGPALQALLHGCPPHVTHLLKGGTVAMCCWVRQLNSGSQSASSTVLTFSSL